MYCPVCKTTELAMAHRQGIEINQCPTCGGMWLDRLELDLLISRATRVAGAGVPALVQAQVHSHGHGHARAFKDSDFGHKQHGHGQRRPFWRAFFD